MRVKLTPHGFELYSQFTVVVDFTVVGQPYRLRSVRHGLTPRGQIDDRQATMRKTNTAQRDDACTIWPAMHKRVPHIAQALLADMITRIESHNARNATHQR